MFGIWGEEVGKGATEGTLMGPECLPPWATAAHPRNSPTESRGAESAEGQGHPTADTPIPHPTLIHLLADSLFSAAVYMIPELGAAGRRASNWGRPRSDP